MKPLFKLTLSLLFFVLVIGTFHACKSISVPLSTKVEIVKEPEIKQNPDAQTRQEPCPEEYSFPQNDDQWQATKNWLLQFFLNFIFKQF